jgi:hypothetical protein
VSFSFLLFGDFQSPFLAIFLERFRGLSLWDLVGLYTSTLRGSFPFDSPPKSVSKGARFWGFLGSRVRGVLGGISSIPLGLSSFGGPNLCYGVPMRCSYYPKVLCKIVERFGRSGVGYGGVNLLVLFIPRAQVTPA